MTIEDEIKALRMTENAAMNLLQGQGVVADECVTLDDVPEPDRTHAAEWLRGWRQMTKWKETTL